MMLFRYHLLFSFFTISSLFLLISCQGTTSVEQKKEKSAQEIQRDLSIRSGEELYKQYCLQCHGLSGNGDEHKDLDLHVETEDLRRSGIHIKRVGPNPIISPPHLTTKELRILIRNGNEVMPPRKDEFTEKQTNDLILYLQSEIFE